MVAFIIQMALFLALKKHSMMEYLVKDIFRNVSMDISVDTWMWKILKVNRNWSAGRLVTGTTWTHKPIEDTIKYISSICFCYLFNKNPARLMVQKRGGIISVPFLISPYKPCFLFVRLLRSSQKCSAFLAWPNSWRSVECT